MRCSHLLRRHPRAPAAAAALIALLHLHRETALFGRGELVDKVLLVELHVRHLLPVQREPAVIAFICLVFSARLAW